MGQNGILTQTVKSKEETYKSREDELRKLTELEAATNLESTVHKDTSTGVEKRITIPVGFAVSQVSGEDNLKDGLVIIDAKGNEWVWIEVPRTIEVYKESGVEIEDFNEENLTKIYNDLKEYTQDYKDDSYADIWYAYEEYHMDQEKYNKLKNTMIQSIYKNQGFWIGRYEAGIETDPRSFNNENNIEHPITQELVLKKNSYVYNWITAYQAEELCEKMKNGSNTTSLMFGLQWDLILKYLETSGSKIKDDLTVDSISWGNFKNSEFKVFEGIYSENLGQNYELVKDEYSKNENAAILFSTGINNRNSCKNIYDLAGNVWEWTLERQKVEHSVETNAVRGGAFNNDSKDYNVSMRLYTNYYFNNYNMGFRPTMY